MRKRKSEKEPNTSGCAEEEDSICSGWRKKIQEYAAPCPPSCEMLFASFRSTQVIACVSATTAFHKICAEKHSTPDAMAYIYVSSEKSSGDDNR